MAKKGDFEKYSKEELFLGLEKRYSMSEDHGVELILAGLVGIFLSLFLKTLYLYKTGLVISDLTNLRDPGIMGIIIGFSLLMLAYGFFKKRKNNVLRRQLRLRKRLVLGR